MHKSGRTVYTYQGYTQKYAEIMTWQKGFVQKQSDTSKAEERICTTSGYQDAVAIQKSKKSKVYDKNVLVVSYKDGVRQTHYSSDGFSNAR